MSARPGCTLLAVDMLVRAPRDSYAENEGYIGTIGENEGWAEDVDRTAERAIANLANAFATSGHSHGLNGSLGFRIGANSSDTRQLDFTAMSEAVTAFYSVDVPAPRASSLHNFVGEPQVLAAIEVGYVLSLQVSQSNTVKITDNQIFLATSCNAL